MMFFRAEPVHHPRSSARGESNRYGATIALSHHMCHGAQSRSIIRDTLAYSPTYELWPKLGRHGLHALSRLRDGRAGVPHMFGATIALSHPTCHGAQNRSTIRDTLAYSLTSPLLNLPTRSGEYNRAPECRLSIRSSFLPRTSDRCRIPAFHRPGNLHVQPSP